MEIIIDGFVYENQSNGGVSRIYSEIIPRICELSKDIQFTMLTAAPLKQSLPSHTRIHHIARLGFHRLLPKKFFSNLRKDIRSVVLSKSFVFAPKKAIWHSTYFTLPYNWKGLNVLTVPDMIFELFPHLFSSLADGQLRVYKRKCIEKADAIICISRSAADDLRSMYNFNEKKPIHVIPLACADAFIQLSDVDVYYSPPTKKRFILYVGSRTHYKNFNKLLKAYSMWELRNDVDLVVVGGKWLGDELNLIRDLNLEGNIHLLTMVTDKVLCYLYNLALAFVYPSLYEGFGLPLLEAMRCGCPIVASNIPTSVEVADGCAVYFDPRDLDNFINALTTGVSLGRNSDQVRSGLVRSRIFSWDRCAKMTFDVYSDLLAGNQ